MKAREIKRGAILQHSETKHEAISKLCVDPLDCRDRTDPRINRPEIDPRDPKKLQWVPKPSQKVDGPHSSMTNVTDLRKYLSKKRGIEQVQTEFVCHCQQLMTAVSAVMDNCDCNRSRVSVFDRLTESNENPTKKTRTASLKEWRAVTSNVVEKWKKITETKEDSESSDEEPHHITRLKSGAVPLKTIRGL